MKKIFILLNMVLLSIMMLGCSFYSVTTTTTTSVSETTTTTTTSYDSRYQILEQEFDYLDLLMPEAMISDTYLPELNNTEITSYITIDGVELESNLIQYVLSPIDLYCTLSVTLYYEELSLTKDYTVIMLRNGELYQQYLIDQKFNELKAMIDEQMPEVIESDFTLPILDNPDATFSFSTDTSRIYNHRFIFSFPLEPTEFHITAKIRYNNETRTYDYPILMKGLSQLQQVPIIYIHTDNSTPITSKTEYLHATFSMVIYNQDLVPFVLYSNRSIQIRGRGNSTFYMPKMSYRLKFDDKTSLLFDHSENDWVLLANFTDQTLIRNALAYNFAASITDVFQPDTAFVDVYLNDVFLGNYTLTDQIEVTNDRVDIDEHSTNLDTGYLIEFDRRIWDWPEGTEGIDWFNLYGIPYVIKSPDPDGEYYSQSQLYYIESYMAECYNALRNKQDYSELIDEESFIDWFIVEELFKNVDSGYSSVFITKDKGGKLKMGPVWDFDLSTSNPGHLGDDLRGPEGWYTSLEYKNVWFYHLMQYEGFRQHLKEKWNAIYDNQIQDLLNDIYPMADSISKSRYLNFQTWDVIGKNYDWYTSTEVYDAKTYEEQVYILYNYLLVRSVWMNQAINEF
ncbi:MAG: CotH kinase family protein [Firmicutes bacterium]|nr:CotH kinase family protein [Bacillota bacterium]